MVISIMKDVGEDGEGSGIVETDHSTVRTEFRTRTKIRTNTKTKMTISERAGVPSFVL